MVSGFIAMNRLGQQLIQRGMITQEQLDEALEYQQTIGGRIGKVLQKLGFVEEEAFAKYLANEYNHTYMSYDELKVDHRLIQRFSEENMRSKKYFPIKKVENKIYLAMSDPMDIEVTDNLSSEWGNDFKIFMVTDRTVEKVLRAQFKGLEERLNFDDDEEADIGDELKYIFNKHSEKRILYSLIELLHTQGKIEVKDLIKLLN